MQSKSKQQAVKFSNCHRSSESKGFHSIKDNRFYVTSGTSTEEYYGYSNYVAKTTKTFNSSTDEPQFDSGQGTGT